MAEQNLNLGFFSFLKGIGFYIVKTKHAKTTMKKHYTPIRTAKMKERKKKRVTTSNASKDAEKPDLTYITGGNVK